MSGRFAPKGNGKSLSISERIRNIESEMESVSGGSVWYVINEFDNSLIAKFDSFDAAAAFRYELIGRRDSEFRFALTNVAIREFYL